MDFYHCNCTAPGRSVTMLVNAAAFTNTSAARSMAANFSACRLSAEADVYAQVLSIKPSREDCVGRNIYVDMGANWCNTLRLPKHVPAVGSMPHAGLPWQVYAFEAAPLIAPFVEQCCMALSRGAGLPHAPVPPSGSSSSLLAYTEKVGCNRTRSRSRAFACIEAKLNATLQALRPSAHLASALPSRMHAARRHGCRATDGPSYHLLAAAVGAHDGTLRMSVGSRGLMSLLRGGMSASYGDGDSTSGGMSGSRPVARVGSSGAGSSGDGGGLEGSQGGSGHVPTVPVPVVDVVRWLADSFTLHDHLVLKIDAEGAENEIVPALLASNASRLVDILLWECHGAVRGGGAGKCQCQAWQHALRTAGGVAAVYTDPYPFAVDKTDLPPFP